MSINSKKELVTELKSRVISDLFIFKLTSIKGVEFQDEEFLDVRIALMNGTEVIQDVNKN